MNGYATRIPVFLFFIKVATAHRSPYAAIWNWMLVQIYGRRNCLVEPQMWQNFWVIESCLFFFYFSFHYILKNIWYISLLPLHKLLYMWCVIASCWMWLCSTTIEKISWIPFVAFHLLMTAICLMQSVLCFSHFMKTLLFTSVYSSDDYYEYGHSGESYDSYGESQTFLLSNKSLVVRTISNV